jgi:hypothetical protein
MIKTTGGILSDLNKMRNSDRLTISILENHTKTFTTEVAKPLADILLPIQKEMAQNPDPAVQVLAGKLHTLLTAEVISIFKKAAEESMQRSKEQFKLVGA